MKKILIALVCTILLTCTNVTAQGGDKTVNVGVTISETNYGYKVVIPDDSSYQELKPTMNLYNNSIKAASVVKPDGKAMPANVSNGKISFAVDQPGEYQVISCTGSDGNLIYNTGVYTSVGSVEDTSIVSMSLEELFKPESKVSSTLSSQDLNTIITNLNNGYIYIMNQSVNIIDNSSDTPDYVNDYLEANPGFEKVKSVDIEIVVTYIEGGNTKSFKITKLSDGLCVTLNIPDDAKKVPDEGKDLVYAILVKHSDGSVEVIKNDENNKNRIVIENGTLAFTTQQFSTFTMLYTQVDKPVSNNSGTSSTGSSSNTTLKPVVNTCAK